MFLRGLFSQSKKQLTANAYRVSEAFHKQHAKHAIPVDAKIKVFVMDGAGSSGDPYGRGTKLAMQTVINEFFKKLNIDIADPISPIEEHMGEGKLPHIKKIITWLSLKNPSLIARYKDAVIYENDAKAILVKLISEGIHTIEKFSTPVPGMVELAKILQARGVTLVLNTAYGHNEASAFERQMASHGVKFAFRMTSSDVKHSRPFPAMLYRIADQFGVYPWEMLVAGDTPADMHAARQFWSLGLVDYSSFVRGDVDKLTKEALYLERQRVSNLLAAEGAHYVALDPSKDQPKSLADKVTSVIDNINLRMSLASSADISTTLKYDGSSPMLKKPLLSKL